MTESERQPSAPPGRPPGPETEPPAAERDAATADPAFVAAQAACPLPLDPLTPLPDGILRLPGEYRVVGIAAFDAALPYDVVTNRRFLCDYWDAWLALDLSAIKSILIRPDIERAALAKRSAESDPAAAEPADQIGRSILEIVLDDDRIYRLWTVGPAREAGRSLWRLASAARSASGLGAEATKRRRMTVHRKPKQKSPFPDGVAVRLGGLALFAVLAFAALMVVLTVGTIGIGYLIVFVMRSFQEYPLPTLLGLGAVGGLLLRRRLRRRVRRSTRSSHDAAVQRPDSEVAIDAT